MQRWVKFKKKENDYHTNELVVILRENWCYDWILIKINVKCSELQLLKGSDEDSHF